MITLLNNLNANFQPTFNSNKIKYKRILNEEKYDAFVTNIIKKEKQNNNGKIFRYKDFLTPKEIKKFKNELKDSIGNFIINNNLHIIKNGKEKDTFIDIIRQV